MQYLDVNQAPPPDAPEGDNYYPSDEEKKDIKLAEKLFGLAKKAKTKYDEKWNDYYNMYRGRQWKEQRPSYRHSEVVNLIFREIQSGVPIQMDSRPKFEFLPMGPEDLELAEIMNQVCEADWNRYNWLAEITEAVYDANILGTGLASVCFDPKQDFGNGSVCLESEDPFYHFPDPSARNFNRKMKYHIKAEPMALDDIKAKWPNGKYVKADVIDIAQMDISDKDKVRVKSPVEARVIADQSQQAESDETPQALVITLWLAGEFEIEEEAVEEETAPGETGIKYVQKMKYPTGRKLVVANKVVLESGPNEYEDGKMPFSRVQNYVNQRQFWGISDVEQLESPQKVFNKLISFSLDVLTLMGNPIWKVGAGSGVDTENLFNQPGLVIEADDISQIQREEGVQLQPYVLQLIDRLKVWFDDVSGSQDISRGAKPEGVTAASAIQSLQEAAQTRIRQKSRNLDAFLQDMGQLYMSRVFQFYDAPRVFRITGKDGAQNFFKFHVEPSPNDPDKKLIRFRPYQMGENGQLFEGEEKVVESQGLLDVKVNTGSTLPFVQADKEAKLFKLFELGIVDEEEVLKGLDFPNWEAVLVRINERKAQAQMAEMQAQGAPPPVA